MLPIKNHGGSTKPQNASRGDSFSVSNGEQDLKMVRSGAELMKSIDYLMHTEVLKDVDELKGFARPPSLLANDLTQGMKQLQLSSNGDVSSLPPRSVLANNNGSILLTISWNKTEYFLWFFFWKQK